MLQLTSDMKKPSIAWTRREGALVAHVVMNGVPLYAMYVVATRFLGIRIDVQLDSDDMEADTYRIRDGYILAERNDVDVAEITDVLYEIVDSIPIISARALA